jgi:predicted nucleic acid-binding protein
MLVVSNTSPISNLAIVGRLEFLPRRYSIVRIPSEVAVELAALTHATGLQRIQAALVDGWLRVEPLDPKVPMQLPFRLDPGEAAAIALACQIKADVLLMDEKRGREAARQSGLVVAGVLGELIHAKLAGWIPNVRNEIQKLRLDAGFFMDATVEKFILSQVAE